MDTNNFKNQAKELGEATQTLRYIGSLLREADKEKYEQLLQYTKKVDKDVEVSNDILVGAALVVTIDAD